MEIESLKRLCVLSLSCLIFAGPYFLEIDGKEASSKKSSETNEDLLDFEDEQDAKKNNDFESILDTKTVKIKKSLGLFDQEDGKEIKEIEVNSVNFVKLPEKAGEIFIPEPKYADVQMLSDNSMYIMGLEPGITALIVNNRKGKTILNYEVRVTYALSAAKKMIKELYPDTNVEILPLGDSVVLKGDVPSPEVASEIQKIVEKFVDSGKIINKMKIATATQVLIKVKVASVDRLVTKSLGIDWRAFSGSNSPNGIHYGFAAGASVLKSLPAYVAQTWDTNAIIENINPKDYSSGENDPEYIAAVAKAKAAAKLSDVRAQITELEKQGGLMGPEGQTGRWIMYNGGRRRNIAGVLDALAGESLTTILAEPTLVTISGKEATFNVGGQIGYNVTQDNGTTTEFKDWGTSLSVTPIVLSEDRISIKVAPKVSSVSEGSDKSSAPSITSKDVSTTVELGSGQSLAIAGLLQTSITTAVNETPLLSELPILGSLFKNSRRTKTQQEIVVIITAYLVKPSSEELVDPTEMVPRLLSPLEVMLSRKFSARTSNEGSEELCGFSIR